MPNNKNTGFVASVLRELRRMLSRPIYFIGTVLTMAFTYLFFSTFFIEGQPNKMPIGIVDLDQSSLSRQFIRNLDATQQAKIVMHLNNFSEARREMQKGNIYAFLVLKDGFSKDAISNRRPTITFYVNDGYLIAGSLILKDMTYMSVATSVGMQRKVLRAKGIDESRIMGIIQPIVADTHLIGNPWANYGTYLLNVIMPGILSLTILIMTAFPIGVEFKQRTSRDWLHKANDSMLIALTSKLLPYTALFTLIGCIGNVILYKIMHFPLSFGIGWMFLATFMLVVASQCVGVLFIGATPVLRDGITFSSLFGTLGVTFAGATFPIEQLPYGAQIFSPLFPIRHYFNIYVNQALTGAGIEHSIVSYLYLSIFWILPLFVFQRLKSFAINQNVPTK